MALPDGKAIDEDKDLDGLQPLSLGEPPSKVELEGADDIEVVIEDDDAADGETKDAKGEEEGADVSAAGEETDDTTAGSDTSDETDDEEFRSFKPAVQKRIEREIRIRRRAEEAANLAVEKVREVETKRATEVEQLNTTNYELQKGYAQVLAAAFTDRIELKQHALKAARDAGDFEKEQALSAEIDDLRFKQNQVKDTVSRLEAAPPAKREEKKEEQQKPAEGQQQQQQVPPLVKKWLASNQWYTNPKFLAQRRFTEVIDAQVKNDGYDPNTQEYFTEMDRRIDKAFPTLRRNKTTSQKTPSPKLPIAGANNEGGTRKAPKGKIVLKRSELAGMLQFKLDPNNPTHLREYARHLKASNGESS